MSRLITPYLARHPLMGDDDPIPIGTAGSDTATVVMSTIPYSEVLAMINRGLMPTLVKDVINEADDDVESTTVNFIIAAIPCQIFGLCTATIHSCNGETFLVYEGAIKNLK